jgi:hypothetical protein
MWVLKLSSAIHFISRVYSTYNTLCHKGLNSNAGTAIFLLLWSDHHRDLKITKHNSVFSLLIVLSELKS